MKKLSIFLLVLLCSCSHESMTMDSYGTAVSQKRQKQKLVVIQSKLDSAEKDQKKIQKNIDLLKDELRQGELDLIRSAVEGCERSLAMRQNSNEVANLFLEEREVLHRMIQSGSPNTSFEAQVVLDQILRIITNLSEVE